MRPWYLLPMRWDTFEKEFLESRVFVSGKVGPPQDWSWFMPPDEFSRHDRAIAQAWWYDGPAAVTLVQFTDEGVSAWHYHEVFYQHSWGEHGFELHKNDVQQLLRKYLKKYPHLGAPTPSELAAFIRELFWEYMEATEWRPDDMIPTEDLPGDVVTILKRYKERR